MSEMKNATVLNAVEGFDPIACKLKEEHSIPLDVKKMWFRLAYPSGRMASKVVEINGQFAIMEARLYLTAEGGDNSYLANGMGMAVRSNTDKVGQYIHEAEDAALDRALYNAGFGVQYAVEVPEEAKAPKRAAAKKTGKVEPPAADTNGQTALTGTSSPTAEETTAETPKEAAPASPAPAEEAAAPVAEAKPVPAGTVTPIEKVADNSALESLLSSMTLREAVAVIVDVGAAKGKTIGQIAKEDPRQLLWFRDSYKGPNDHIRAAATLLLREAGDTSSSAPKTLAA